MERDTSAIEATVQIVCAALQNKQMYINAASGTEVANFAEVIYKKIRELQKI